jgi:hypothetical protein
VRALAQSDEGRAAGSHEPPEGLHGQTGHPGTEAVQLLPLRPHGALGSGAARREQPEVEARTRWGVIQSINREVVEVRFDDGEVVRYRNHETGRLSIVTSASGPVSVNDQYSLLRAGGSCFSVARDAGRPLQPCATDDVARTDPAALAERLHTHGGLSAPLHDG